VSIRPATADEWPCIWPFWRDIVLAGETYAYPEDLTSEQAAALWLERPPSAGSPAWPPRPRCCGRGGSAA
jgi:hypothetical protein